MKLSNASVGILAIVEVAYIVLCAALLPDGPARVACIIFSLVQALVLAYATAAAVGTMGFHAYGRPAAAGVCYALQLAVGTVLTALMPQNLIVQIAVGVVLLAASLVLSIAAAASSSHADNVDEHMRRGGEKRSRNQ